MRGDPQIEDQLADTELKDDLVSEQNAAELVYLFEAILEKGQHLQMLYPQGSNVPSQTCRLKHAVSSKWENKPAKAVCCWAAEMCARV